MTTNTNKDIIDEAHKEFEEALRVDPELTKLPPSDIWERAFLNGFVYGLVENMEMIDEQDRLG